MISVFIVMSFPMIMVTEVLNYLHEDLLPKAGVLESDRSLLKEASADHAAFRSHSGDGGEVTWQARLQKSGILIFELLEAGDPVVQFI